MNCTESGLREIWCVVVLCPSYATTLLTNRIKIYLVGSDKKKPKISVALLPFIQLLRSRIICSDTCWCFVNTDISGRHNSFFLSTVSATCASCLTSQTHQSRDLFEKEQTCGLIILVRGHAHISPRSRRRNSSGYILAARQGRGLVTDTVWEDLCQTHFVNSVLGDVFLYSFCKS